MCVFMPVARCFLRHTLVCAQAEEGPVPMVSYRWNVSVHYALQHTPVRALLLFCHARKQCPFMNVFALLIFVFISIEFIGHIRG